MSGQVDIVKLWEAVNHTLREGAINRPLWEAAMTAVPLALEEDSGSLVLGMPTERMELAGHIETRVNKARLQEIIQARIGRRLDLKVIEGISTEAYRRAAEREQLRAQAAEEAHAKAMGVRTAAASWDQLNEQILLAHSATEGRRFDVNRARFLIRCVRMVADAEHRIRDRDPGREDFHERQLMRSLDKIAGLCEAPPIVVSLEYLRCRASRERRAS
jgi:hypothetical protein